MADTKYKPYKHCNYLKTIRVEVLRKQLKLAAKALRESKFDYDSLAFTGVSGALLAPTLALRLNKHLVVVRKKKDAAHSIMPVEGYLTQKYIIVDDFVCTGKTAERIKAEIEIFSPGAICLGVLEVRDLTDYKGGKVKLS